jgi:pyruvate dehydrogenase E2 component (dihydrolipoamide acetyltransferase)
MSRKIFALPDLGEGLTEAQLVRWLVAPGEEVAIDAPVAEVETAKAMVEIPSPYAGVVAELHGTEGTVIAVGSPLISITTQAAAYLEEERAGSGNVLIGYGTSPQGTRRRRRNRHAAGTPATHSAASSPPATTPGSYRTTAGPSASTGTPAVTNKATDDPANVDSVAGEADAVLADALAAGPATVDPAAADLAKAGEAYAVLADASAVGPTTAGPAGAHLADGPATAATSAPATHPTSGRGPGTRPFIADASGGAVSAGPATTVAGGGAAGAAGARLADGLDITAGGMPIAATTADAATAGPGRAGLVGAHSATIGPGAAISTTARLRSAGTGSTAGAVSGPPGAATRSDASPATTRPAAGPIHARMPAGGSAIPPTSAAGGRPAVSSPVVRKLAKDNGVDLTLVQGSGPGGLITRTDVERVIAVGVDSRTGLGVAERIPLRGIRAAIAATLARSRAEIPEATTWVDVDATELVRLRAALVDGPGLLAYVARFVVAGLARYPVLNSIVDSDEIRVFDGVNLGIATQTERGLVVPVVRDAHRRTARALDGEIRRVTAAARDGSTAILGGGSFTLNNYGAFGVDGSAAIINHPEVAILGMGRIIERPWVVGGEVRPRHLTQLSLVFDHRVCDGGTAAGFLRFVADAVESPGSVLADL